MEYGQLWLLCGVGAAILARHKGRSALAWLCVGFLCGPVALVVALLPARGASAQGPIPTADDPVVQRNQARLGTRWQAKP